MAPSRHDHRIHGNKPSERGIALFVVLILVLVLTVVITQLIFVTKIEERITNNRLGRTSLSYAVQASARQVLQTLSDDLMNDLGYLAEDDLESDMMDGFGDVGGAGSQLPGGLNIPGGTGGGGGGGEGEGDRSDDPVDTHHDRWADPIQDSINGIQVEGVVVDGESCIDLNHLFELVSLSEEEEEIDSEEIGEQSPEAQGLLDDFLAGEEIGEEFIPPEQEDLEEAQIVLERLVEALVDYNEEYGFDYNETPNPSAVAEAIVTMVHQRVLDENQRRIRSLDSIRRLEEITWELFYGPIDPETLEEESDGFDDLGIDSQIGDISEIIPGTFAGLESAGYELEDGGVSQLPTPIGLRHVLTANSSGKINLNTARPEVLIALLRSFDDFEEAKEIAWMIREHCNNYQQEIDEVTGEILDDLMGSMGIDEEEQVQEFQHFTSFEQIKQVDPTWEEDSGSEDSIYALLSQDLEEHTVFSSNFFTATIEGTSEDRSLSGRMVCARKGQHVVVLSWKEVRR